MSVPLPIVKDEPPHVKEEIDNNSDQSTSLALGTPSNNLENVVIRPKRHFKEISIYYRTKKKIEIHTKMGDRWRNIIFKHDLEETAYVKTKSSKGNSGRRYIEDSKITCHLFYFKEFGKYLKPLFDHPNQTVDLLRFRFNCDNCDRSAYVSCLSDRLDFIRTIRECMVNMRQPLRVKHFDCWDNTSSDALIFLSYLHIDVIEKFTLKRILAFTVCWHLDTLHHLTDDVLTTEHWWNIPVTVINRPEVGDLHRILQHARETPTFISFEGTWHQPRHCPVLSVYAEIPLETFGDGIEWRSESGKNYAKVSTTDPNFVIKITLNNDKIDQSVCYERSPVTPRAPSVTL